MNRLHKHFEGEVDLTATQIRAAQLFLSKTLPDLARTEVTGKDGGPQEFKDVTQSDAEILANYLKGSK